MAKYRKPKTAWYMRLFLTGLLVLSVGFFHVSCSGDSAKKPTAPRKPVAKKKVKPKPPPKVEEKKEEKPVYAYNPIGKRDPFEVFNLVSQDDRDNVQKTELQKYGIEQLSLVGIIWGISNPRAMVQAPGRKGFVVKKGTLIGRNWGKVTRIKPDEIIIAEEFRDIDGRLVVNEISMKLPRKKGLEELERSL